MNNEVRNYRGQVIGYKCIQCGKVVQSMWNITCNDCRKKNKEHEELITEIKELRKTIAELKTERR